MKITNMVVKLLNAVSTIVETSAGLYHMARDFVVSTLNEIKGHFGKVKKD